MARNDKVPFRREITVTENGYVGNSTGFFVGDIMSLHVNTEHTTDDLTVQAKSSVSGTWETIYSGPETEGIDIRMWEHIRVFINISNGTSQVVLFGYDLPVDSVKTVNLNEKDSSNVFYNNIVTEKILKQLEIMNIHLGILTDLDISEGDL
jgi:hypothetical protein